MDDKPFVTIKRAGSAKINDNDTGGRRLADIDVVDGHVETLRNTSTKPEEISQRKGWIAKTLENQVIAAVVAGLIVLVLGAAFTKWFSS